jgi:hypothetical protein
MMSPPRPPYPPPASSVVPPLVVATKFGQVSDNVRYSGGPIDENFQIIPCEQFSPLQSRAGDAKSKCKLFDFCTVKDRRKVYRGPTFHDPLTDLSLSALCKAIMMDAQTCGIDTFLYAPDNKGKIWNMTKHYNRMSFDHIQTYIDHCLGPLPAIVTDSSGQELPSSKLARAKVFDAQARTDSTHLWNLVTSYVDEALISPIQDRLESYGNRGPGLLLFCALIAEVTSHTTQAMDDLHTKFRAITLTSYPGENIRLLVADIISAFSLMKSGGSL